MEEKLLKLGGHLWFILLAVWIIAAAIGKGNQGLPGKPKGKNRAGGCNPYRGLNSNMGAAKYYESSVTGGEAADGSAIPFGSAVL